MGEAGVLTYVYCVAEGAQWAAPKAAVRGLPLAEKPRELPLDEGYELIVASVPAAEYASEQIDARLKDLEWVSACAVGHERIIEHYASKTTVIPLKLFTLFSSDERAVKDVAKKLKNIARTMKKLSGREEWGVRIFFDELAALKELTKTHRSEGPAASGRNFLERKKSERDVMKQAQTFAAEEAAGVFEALALAADDAIRRTPAAVGGGARLVLDAAFLVGKGANKRFQHAVEEHAQRLGALGYEVKLTGPWPPYNFVGEGS